MTFAYVDIQAVNGGFGEFQAGANGDEFDSLDDLISDFDAVEIKDGIDLPEGAEDIRGLIRDEPDHVFVVLQGGHAFYFGANVVD